MSLLVAGLQGLFTPLGGAPMSSSSSGLSHFLAQFCQFASGILMICAQAMCAVRMVPVLGESALYRM